MTEDIRKIAVMDDGSRIEVKSRTENGQTTYATIDPPEDFDPRRIDHYEEIQ